METITNSSTASHNQLERVKNYAENTYYARVYSLANNEIAKLTGEQKQNTNNDRKPDDSNSQILAIVYGTTEALKGDGGWGAIIVKNNNAQELSDNEPKTTANRMILEAATAVLVKLNPGSTILIQTRSDYLYKGATEWLTKWIKNGWQSAEGGEVKHQRLWQKLYELSQTHTVAWELITFDKENKYHNRLKELVQSQIERIPPRIWD